MEFFSTPNLILAVGLLLLVSPVVSGALTAWISSVAGRFSERRDFEKRTVAEILDLRERCAKHGLTKAERICRELLLAVVYGDRNEG